MLRQPRRVRAGFGGCCWNTFTFCICTRYCASRTTSACAGILLNCTHSNTSSFKFGIGVHKLEVQAIHLVEFSPASHSLKVLSHIAAKVLDLDALFFKNEGTATARAALGKPRRMEDAWLHLPAASEAQLLFLFWELTIALYSSSQQAKTGYASGSKRRRCRRKDRRSTRTLQLVS